MQRGYRRWLVDYATRCGIGIGIRGGLSPHVENDILPKV